MAKSCLGLQPTKLLRPGDFPGKKLEWVASLRPGDLPNPGIEPASLTSRALAGGFFTTSTTWEFPGDSVRKESSYHAGDLGSIPGSGRSLGR